MFNLHRKYGFIFITVILLAQCSNSENSANRVIAQVEEKKLMLSELENIIPGNLSKQDSTVMADDYVRKWIKQELVILKANENLTPQQKDVSRELQDYRNSLIIYKYKNELMKQRMDTTVTAKQIEDYYNTNPDNFNLSKNIVKAIFIKIPLEVANPEMLKNMAGNTSEEGLNELREYCVRYAKGFDIFINNWVDFEVLKNNIPSEITDVDSFLAGNQEIEAKDSNYYYLVRIQDYRLKNEIAPLEFVENNIKNLILNQRKIEFLKEVEENIYIEGERQNKFIIFN